MQIFEANNNARLEQKQLFGFEDTAGDFAVDTLLVLAVVLVEM